ncbi:hypothetical protein JRO89_XS09G0225000 [Xanthoceras sorbifolium]|uniref:Jacalin-type lectin domain-containing protein n=1 Tax=Xanthoceras sorbifolium TaxID=99658 RepID=A0ABQ8HMH1_9ROSI|nr:hypothetical protein JRO89_XS09G0225000 [Xanthoceras sorbifolium]
MVVHASYSYEHSLNGLEAFQVGPYGEKNGREWSYIAEGAISDVSKGVIVGFYGSVMGEEHHWTYGTLGVYVKHSTDLFGSSSQIIRSDFKKQECIKVGPWGWSRSVAEEEWSYMLKGGAFTEIKIGYNRDSIKWISFKSLEENAQEVKYSKKSDTSGEKIKVCVCVCVCVPEEYLISLSGSLRDIVKDIESLCFYTNRTIYGPFGTMKGTPFSFNMKGGTIVDFYGHVGDCFDALGAYIKPFSELFGSSSQGQTENARVKVGPFGGQGGKEWVYQPNNGAIT